MESTRTIARALSTKHSVSQDLDSFAVGLLDSYVPENVGLYNQYRSYLHDILCLGLVSSGLYSNQGLSLEALGIFVPDHKLMAQRPDLYTIKSNSLDVCEVTFSYNHKFDEQKKRVKYNALFEIISRELGLEISYSVICVDLTDSEWADQLPPIDDQHLKMLIRFVDNLRIIHSNPIFHQYRSNPPGASLKTDIDFKIDEGHLSSIVSEIVGEKIGYRDYMTKIGSGADELSDEEYLDTLCYSILDGKVLKRPSPHPEPISTEDFDRQWKEFSRLPANTTKTPRVLQLGCPSSLREVDENLPTLVGKLRSTTDFGGYLDYIKMSLQQNPGVPDQGLIHLSLTQSQLEFEQMQGPGRKQLLKSKGVKLDRSAPTHIGIDPSHILRLESLTAKIDSLTDVELNLEEYPDMSATGPAMHTQFGKMMGLIYRCPMTAVNKFYQRLSQEIVLNSMRRRKNRQYVLASSGFDGVFFIVAPGPQLRTESNTEFIKIISSVAPVVDLLAAPWHPIGNHWESDWLSVDTDRLKHWMRSHDRLIMAQLACAERLTSPEMSFNRALSNEIKYGNYQFLSLCYLEDKSTTSTTNQTIRYLWIKSLGDKMMDGIYKKFPPRVNSVLQSTMLQRSYTSCRTVLRGRLNDFIKVSQVSRDDETGLYDETTTGVTGKLPRLITVGEHVPIAYNLNEIYWCMMYNKDRQNPTQDAMGILNKILKEEQKFDNELASRTNGDKINYLTGTTTVRQDVAHIHSENPESHYFSSRAVRIGIELQDAHRDNMAPNGTWLNTNKLNEILNKKLSDFATFKASVKSIKEFVDQTNLDDIKQLGSRTKAIELVYELVNHEQLCTSLDVVMSVSGDKNSSFEVLIQIFKKNQVGGVREIIILYIKARILFNILEEISRLLSKSDKREILTKGKDKRLMMRGDYEDVMANFKRGSPVQLIKHSYDMTTWAQHFIPTIFINIFKHHFKNHPGMLNLASFVFTKHTDKKMEFPRKLVEQWSINRKTKHKESWLNDAKERFTTKGQTYFKNRSNMCQGIPHYSSTVLALSCQSLRDDLFHRCLNILGEKQKIYWQTRVGSDDKGDIIGVDMSDKKGYSQYILFEQCALAAERLHSMELSVKSASGNLIYELNSAFMVNLETLSPTIKFATASTDMIGTTSCSSFVNESFTRIRQLRENGASSLVCLTAHYLNKIHFEQMFRVGPGMSNDPTEIFDTYPENIPFDFGVYPMYDCDLQDIIGPEYHNYNCLTKEDRCYEAVQLLYTPLSGTNNLESFLPSEEENELLKKDHFNISQGMVRQLTNMRRRMDLNSHDVEAYLNKNPFMVLRGPSSLEEVKYTIASKLFTKGAADSLRRTSPAIYFGRLTAFESARAWKLQCKTERQIADFETMTIEDEYESIDLTYKEFLTMGLERSKDLNLPVDEMKTVIFPQSRSFEVVKQFVGNFGVRKSNSKYFSQAVRNWIINNFNYNFTSSLKDIMETSIGTSQLASISDVEEFRNLLGMKLDSIDGILEECEAKSMRPLDLFFYMARIYKNVKTSKVQVFASGPSSQTLQRTLINLKKYNHIPNTTMIDYTGISVEQETESKTLDRMIDLIKFACNLTIMEDQGYITSPRGVLNSVEVENGISLREAVLSAIRRIKGVMGFDLTTQKIIIYMVSTLMSPEEVKECLLTWKMLNYSYIKRQKKVMVNGQPKWEGDLSLLVNSHNDVYKINVSNGYHYLECKRIMEVSEILRNLRTLCRMLDFELSNFFTMTEGKIGDLVLSADGRRIVKLEDNLNNVRRLNIRYNAPFTHSRLIDFDNFKVIKSVKNKDSSIEIHLQQRGERSATICHMTGSCYPVEVPTSVVVDPTIWCRGIRLSRILDNRDWFFNGRLSVMSDMETVEFLKNDINLPVILANTNESRTSINEYIQIHEEVNEEAFNILHNEETFGTTGYKIKTEDFQTGRLMDLFQKEVDDLRGESYFLGSYEAIGDWADEVEGAPDLDKMGDALNKEDGLRLVRSLGTRVTKRRKNYMMLTTLQQGAMMKKRILDMFFNMSSIMSEEKHSLPYYCLWLMDVKIQDRDLRSLIEELLSYIKAVIVSSTGATIDDVNRVLNQSNRSLKRSLPRMAAYLYSDDSSQSDIYNLIAGQGRTLIQQYEDSVSSSGSSGFSED